MADTYSTRLRLRKIERNAYPGTWDTPLNRDMVEIVDAAIAGEISISIGSATSYTLAALVDGTQSDTHYASLIFTGTPASAVTVTIPTSVTRKRFRVKNSTGQILTFKYSTGSGVVLGNGDVTDLWCDQSVPEVYDVGSGYRITTAEIAAGVTPVNYAKFPTPIRDLSRHVDDNTGGTDVSIGFNEAIQAGTDEIIIPEGTYRIDSKLLADVQGKRLVGVSPWGSIITLHSSSADSCAIEVTARLVEISNLIVFAPATKTGIYLKTAQLFRSNQLTVKTALNGLLHEDGNSAGIRNFFAESCVTGYLMKATSTGNTNGSHIHGRSINCTTGFKLDTASGGGLTSSYNTIDYSTEDNTVGFYQRGGRYNKLTLYSEANTTNWDVDLTAENIWDVSDVDATFPASDHTSYADVRIGVGANLYSRTTWHPNRIRTMDFAASGSLAGVGVDRFRVTNSSGSTRGLTLSMMTSAPIGYECEVIKTDNTAGFTFTAPGGMTLIHDGSTFGASPVTYAIAYMKKISSTEILVRVVTA